MYSGGTFQKIPIAPFGLNDFGVIAGNATEPDGDSGAAIYESGQLIDLNSLVDPSTTFLAGAAEINNSGQIVVSGLNGQIYVLTPRTPAP